jgi:hypothetical protein
MLLGVDPEPQCPNCGYDLRGLGGRRASKCPECGKVPKWRHTEPGFRGSLLTWLAGVSAFAALPLAIAIAYWRRNWFDPPVFPAVFVWSWLSLVVCLTAGYWRSGRFAAVAHGLIVGGVFAAIWASMCFLLIERLAQGFR